LISDTESTTSVAVTVCTPRLQVALAASEVIQPIDTHGGGLIEIRIGDAMVRIEGHRMPARSVSCYGACNDDRPAERYTRLVGRWRDRQALWF
jgi:hypothetical protein